MSAIRLTAYLLLLATAILTPSSRADQPVEEGFKPLFDGKSVDGWVKRGGDATYTVQSNQIVGASVPHTPNTFLCTPREYGDFVLLLEFKVDDGLNSGIQIRSHCFDEKKEVQGKYPNGKPYKGVMQPGRVHGYQVEIDPSGRSWSGGIYDEARRGWLDDLKGDEHKAAREAFRHNDWNEYRIEARGNSIKTWVNGVPAADLKDDMTAKGFIALQVHGIGGDAKKVGKTVRWRNVRIKELN